MQHNAFRFLPVRFFFPLVRRVQNKRLLDSRVTGRVGTGTGSTPDLGGSRGTSWPGRTPPPRARGRGWGREARRRGGYFPTTRGDIPKH